MTTNTATDKFETCTYPPFFRLEDAIDHKEGPLISSSSDTDYDYSGRCSLPVIDLQRTESKSLTSACREWGMFRLVNHGVPASLLDQLIESANKLFSSLTFESKESIFTSPAPMHYFWGSPALTMSGNSQRRYCSDDINWLEGLNVPLGNKISGFSRYEEDPLLESFRSLLEEYGSHQIRIAKAIFSILMAENLNMSTKRSESSYLSESNGIIRVYRYLRCPKADEKWGIDAHTDSSVLSIVHQDQAGGLQVCKKKNEWFDVEPIHNTLIDAGTTPINKIYGPGIKVRAGSDEIVDGILRKRTER